MPKNPAVRTASIRRAGRYIVQPTGQMQTAWSWGQVIFPLLPSVVAAIITGFYASLRSSVVVLAIALLVTLLVLAMNAARRLASEVHRYEREPRAYLELTADETRLAEMFHFPKQAFPLGGAPAASATGSFALTETTVASAGTIPYVGSLPEPSFQRPPIVAGFARVKVANEPPADFPGLLAGQAAVTISIFDADEVCVIDRMQGRWSASKQEHERDRVGTALDHLAADIHPNGIQHPVDVAMKYRDDADCFAYNDDNSNANGGRLQEHRLSGEQFRVEVTVRPATGGDPVTRTFTLTNPGVGGWASLAAVAD